MTSRDEELASLRFALEGAEAEVLRLAVEAGDQAREIQRLRLIRACLLDDLEHAQVKVRAINRAIQRNHSGRETP